MKIGADVQARSKWAQSRVFDRTSRQYNAYLPTSERPRLLIVKVDGTEAKVPDHLPPLSRRNFLEVAACGGLFLSSGCGGDSGQNEVKREKTTERLPVPLRVLVAGTPHWAETLRTAWSSISEQKLQLEVLDTNKTKAEEFDQTLIDMIRRADVAIVPSGALAALDSGSHFTDPTSSLLDERGFDAATMLPVLREGLMKFGGRTIGLPLGALQPAVFLSGRLLEAGVKAPIDWNEYIETVKSAVAKNDSSEPIAAEPLAAGAAGKMFLWRANSERPPVWLFDRENFSPVIDSEPYVDALQKMKRCVDAYGEHRFTAAEVWSRMVAGKVQMGIGWPAKSDDEVGRFEQRLDGEFSPLPKTQLANAELDVAPIQTLVDYDSPLALLSSECRQSEAAKRLIIWLAGGEGTKLIRELLPEMTALRLNSVVSGTEVSGDYSIALAARLSSLAIRTPLRLHRFKQYAATLDNAVLSCLNGKSSAAESLAEAATQWQKITEEVGPKVQIAAWRKAQGLRS